MTAGAQAGAASVVVVGPPRAGLPGVSFVREEPPGAGPVPALSRGLAETDAAWLAVLAADLPFLRARHLDALRDAARRQPEGRHGAVLADDGGRPQGLAGCWPADVLRDAAARYRGDSLRGLLGPLAPVLLGPPAEPGLPPPWLDCDTPDDLRRARQLAGPAARQVPNHP